MAPAAIRGVLDRVISSDIFSRSERARRLLAHLVQLHLDDRRDRMKGSALAVDVFGKDSELGAASASIVRVQVGRLRELLTQYYAGAGRHDEVRVEIPVGSYEPRFRSILGDRPAKPVAVEESRPIVEESAKPAARSRLLVSGSCALLAAALVIGLLRFTSAPALDVTAASSDKARNAEVADLTLQPALSVTYDNASSRSRQIGETIAAALPGFDAISFFRDTQLEMASPAAARGLAFIIDVGDGVDPGSVKLTLEHVQTGQILLSRVLGREELAAPMLHERLAATLTNIAQPTGVVYAFIEQRYRPDGIIGCRISNERFRRTLQLHDLLEAYSCLEDLRESGVKLPAVFAMLASREVDAVLQNFEYPQGASIEHALEMAQLAVGLGPTNAFAHRELSYVYLRLGKYDQVLRWAGRAYDLNRFDITMMATYGCSYIYVDQFEIAADLSARAMAGSVSYPRFWDSCSFIANFMLGRDAKAIRAANAMDTIGRPQYWIARIIAANLDGQAAQAKALIEAFKQQSPQFAADPAASLRKFGYTELVVTRLMEALVAAGFSPEA